MSVPKRILHSHRRSALHRLDLDTAFFWLLMVFLLTVLTFISLRTHPIQLNASQIAEYERRCQFLSNSTVYLIQAKHEEKLLTALPRADWVKISGEIDYVAYVFDDLPLFLTDGWVRRAEESFAEGMERVRKGLGVAVFECGCLIPNEYFKRVDVRLKGLECMMLPGWVLGKDDVYWIGGDWGRSACKGREEMLDERIGGKFDKEVGVIYEEVERIRREIEDDGKEEEAQEDGTKENMR